MINNCFFYRTPTKPNLSIDDLVDFGNVVANSKVISKEINVYNRGSKEGEFKINYTGSHDFTITPSSGKVPARSVQSVRVSETSMISKHPTNVILIKLFLFSV